MRGNRAPITNDERHLHVVGCRASKPQMPHAVAATPTYPCRLSAQCPFTPFSPVYPYRGTALSANNKTNKANQPPAATFEHFMQHADGSGPFRGSCVVWRTMRMSSSDGNYFLTGINLGSDFLKYYI